MQPGSAAREKSESTKRRLVLWAGLLALFVPGIILVYISATPEVDLVGKETLDGTASFGTSFVQLTLPSAAAVDATLAASPCGMDYHFLRAREWADFNRSGVLPLNPLGCERRNASLLPGVVALAIESRRVEPTDYRFEFSFFVLRSPLAIYAFPGFLLVLAGSVGIIISILRSGLRKTLDLLVENKR
ncbi:MAG: hypothetical protein V3W28_09000 [Thermoplasmata archaeon]